MKTTNCNRRWTAYEKNQLLKFGFSLANLDQYQDQPVQYITGYAQFLDYYFKVNHQVLIPRVESEGLVIMGLEFLTNYCPAKTTQELSFADVGTGSGNIGISLFLQSLETHLPVTAILSDISAPALSIAKENVQHLVVVQHKEKIKIIESDLLANFPKTKLDLIVANLPYIPDQYLDSTSKSVTEFEPAIALAGGEDGLKFIRQLLTQAQHHLSAHGLIILELDERTKVSAENLGLNNSNWNYLLVSDVFKKQRYLLVSPLSKIGLNQIALSLHND